MKLHNKIALSACGLICAASVSVAQPAAPDFGSNVLIFDASMPMAAIQSNVSAVFIRQERSQFGANRYAFFFKPGRYELDINVGFYTQVLGLGATPDDVSITGRVHSEAEWMGGNATCTFWRSCENMAEILTSTNPVHWAVSQGTSFRRMHVRGDLNLWDRGWSSGGFMADCKIDGQVNSGTQQQWFSRNDDWDGWTGSNWNMVFVGVVNAPAGNWPKPPFTVVEKTPLLREKPYLVVDKAGRYAVMAPAYDTNGAVGISWAKASAAASIPIDRFYLAHPEKDNAESINAALGQGKNLIFTPGVYHLEKSVCVTHPGTIVMGLGFTTLIPDAGTPAMVISDVDGVTVAGIMFDAGGVDSPALLQVGEKAGAADHSSNPICLYDVYFRVGGATVGTASACLTINANNVIGDNLWIWRADHGQGANWNSNQSKNGLIVNGSNVTLYGLFVEHFQEYQTLWNGNGGRVYFYQCELPYDAPTQSVWQHDGVDGYAAYKVADSVTSHEAWGLGVYGVFNRCEANTKCFNALETPTDPAVKVHHVISVWIAGKEGTETTHIINGTGPAVNRSRRTATID